jgi:electron transport complex protein RnfC
MPQQVKTFKKGGIHPHYNKFSADKSIEYGKVPEKLLVSVNQHIGRPSELVAAKGETVTRGQLLAKSTGFVSSNVYAPAGGRIEKIVKFPQLGGGITETLLIKTENPGQSIKEILDQDQPLPVNIQELDKKEILQKINDAGLVGMGGAGFPTHVKLAPPEDKKIDNLLINGAECEPYITCDHRLMLEKSAELAQGMLILQKVFNGIPVTIGIEVNKPDAIEAMEKAVQGKDGLNVIGLKTKYPQGGEKQLIKAILGREVPSGGLPMDVSVVVQNVATTIAVYEAIFFGRPLMERVMTVSGNLVKNPGNILLPIGTPVSDIMEHFGIDGSKVRLMLSGGPMMGRASYSFESPTTKTSSAVLFFDEAYVKARKENPCIRCGRCIEVCPMGLAVAQLTESVKAELLEGNQKPDILDCIECGSCTYVCPADRRLVHWMRMGKNIIRREKN